MLHLLTAALSVTFELHSEANDAVEAPTPYTVTTATYYSDPITLAAGEMVFTSPQTTELKMPNGSYAITRFIGDIVYADTKQPVPLSEVYDHHWIAISSDHVNQLCGGKPAYTFGIGAESRNNPVAFPPGHGYVVPPNTYWGANIHLLRTEGLAGDNPYKAAKECNECYWAPGKGPNCTPKRNGTFVCCGEHAGSRAKCPTKPFPPAPRAYQLRYTMSYTRETRAIVRVNTAVATAPNCHVFYPVTRNDFEPYDRVSYTWTSQATVDVLFAVGHLHVGGVNVSLSINGQHVCTSYPRYGTREGVAGDEKGYVVEMSPCIGTGAKAGAPPMRVHKGDVATIDGVYYVGSHDPRLLYSDGTHLNVMSYMYIAYSRPAESLQGDWDAEWWAAADGPAPADAFESLGWEGRWGKA